MLRRLLILICLTLSLVSTPASATGRILVLNGYVDGLPFPRRIKDEVRNLLEQRVPGVVVHSQSLDIYRPQPEGYKQLLVDLINLTYRDQIDLIIALDGNAFDFYRERLAPTFGEVPILYVNDRSEMAQLRENEYSLLIRPNFRETLRIAKHHVPDLQRLYLVGDRYNEDLAASTLEGLLSEIELINLGQLSLAQMRDRISQLGQGDLLFFQLIFADGEGKPMVPPVRYMKEFAELSPVPTLCMYANFIAAGCFGGSVSSPEDQAEAIAEAVQIFAYDEVSLAGAKWERLPAPPTGSVLRRFASQSLVDYQKLKRFNMDSLELSGVTYINKPPPIYQGYARELTIFAVIGLILMVLLVIYLWIIRRQRNILHRFASLTDNAPTGIFWLDEQMSRWHHNERIEQWATELNKPISEIREAALLHQRNQRDESIDFALGDGTVQRYFKVRATEYDSRPELLLLEDTTEIHLYQRRLHEQAMVDDLTGLPNRRALHTALERWSASNMRETNPFAVMLIDLDGFKPINDQFGHATGDQVLREIGARLKSRSRQSDILGRLGGDEFLLLAQGVSSTSECAYLCNQFLKLLREPIKCIVDNQQRTLQVDASIGVAFCPEHTTDPELLLLFADRAMYSVKQSGRGNWRIYRREQSTSDTESEGLA